MAVLAVVLYHMSPVLLPSGLMGVTLFFVLSGYLITGILIREWRTEHTIRLKRFWVHRVRRLLPAILLCVSVTAILTALFAPDLLTKLRRDLLASLFWFSNWWYIFLDQSYFEAAGAPSPVTHFWSLAIEEQFYLIWPLFLLGLFKLNVRRSVIAWSVLGFCIASALLMAALYNPDLDPTRVYYGTDTRAFSLLFGSFLAFAFPIKKLQEQTNQEKSSFTGHILGVLGLLAVAGILACMVVINRYDALLYNGGIAAVTVLTGILILALVVPHTLVARFFSAAPLVYLGRISYGIYIWHFPLLLLLNPQNSTATPHPVVSVLQCILIVIVASCSYFLVEQPIRQGVLGEMWNNLRLRRISWQKLLRQHVLYVSAAVILLLGTGVAFAVTPSTPTLQNFSSEVPLNPIVPDGLLSNGQSSRSTQQSDISLQEREKLLKQLGSCSALKALSNTTLEQLVNTPGFTAQEKAHNTQFLLIGDSVSSAFSDKFYGGFSEMFPQAILDANYNRRLLAGIPILKNYLAEGWDGPCVVVELATNGPVDEASLDAFIAAVPEGRAIFIATTRGVADLEEINNDQIYAAAVKYPNVVVLDWYALSMNRDYYFDGDGTHLSPQSGRDAFLDMILVNLETLYQ